MLQFHVSILALIIKKEENKLEAGEELMTTRFDLWLTNQRKGTSLLRPLKMAACDVTAHRAQDGRFEDGLRERQDDFISFSLRVRSSEER